VGIQLLTGGLLGRLELNNNTYYWNAAGAGSLSRVAQNPAAGRSLYLFFHVALNNVNPAPSKGLLAIIVVYCNLDLIFLDFF